MRKDKEPKRKIALYYGSKQPPFPICSVQARLIEASADYEAGTMTLVVENTPGLALLLAKMGQLGAAS